MSESNSSTPATPKNLRFISHGETENEQLPFNYLEWISRAGLTECEDLVLIRATMPPYQAHQFHYHPGREEIIYVLEGEAEQWVEKECRILKPGESAHIPAGMVHATYNRTGQPLVFLAILSKAVSSDPFTVDVWEEEPWSGLTKPSVE